MSYKQKMSHFLYDEEIKLSQVLAGQNHKMLKSVNLIVDKTEGAMWWNEFMAFNWSLHSVKSVCWWIDIKPLNIETNVNTVYVFKFLFFLKDNLPLETYIKETCEATLISMRQQWI